MSVALSSIFPIASEYFASENLPIISVILEPILAPCETLHRY